MVLLPCMLPLLQLELKQQGHKDMLQGLYQWVVEVVEIEVVEVAAIEVVEVVD